MAYSITRHEYTRRFRMFRFRKTPGASEGRDCLQRPGPRKAFYCLGDCSGGACITTLSMASRRDDANLVVETVAETGYDTWAENANKTTSSLMGHPGRDRTMLSISVRHSPQGNSPKRSGTEPDPSSQAEFCTQSARRLQPGWGHSGPRTLTETLTQD